MSLQAFYVVTARTAPWDKSAERIVGYYAGERLANAVAKLVSNHNIQRLSGGIDLDVQKFIGEPADRSAIIQSDLDITERDRLLSLRFRETFKRARPESPSAAPANKTHVPDRAITETYNRQVAGANFSKGCLDAETYANETYGAAFGDISISFRGSGICAMSIGLREVDPIELQIIALIADKNDGKPLFSEIGKVLPEKDHLLTLKSAAEITEEIKALVDQFFTSHQTAK